MIKQYLSAAPAHHQDGLRVILVGPVPQRQRIFQSAADVAAAAGLLDLAVQAGSAEVLAACQLADELAALRAWMSPAELPVERTARIGSVD